MGEPARPGEPELGIEILRADLGSRAARSRRSRRSRTPEIPQTRIGRSAKLGTAIGGQATRYAGTVAANVARSREKKEERLETRHIEAALKMASVLGEMKGAAMKIGQMASFIDHDFLPPSTARSTRSGSRSSGPMRRRCLGTRCRRCSRRSTTTGPRASSRRSRRTPSPPPRSGRSTGRTLHDGSKVAVKVQYPGIADALESDVANAGIIVRLAKALAPGLDAKAVASELSERVLEELDYEFEALRTSAPSRALTTAIRSSTSPRSTPGSPAAA